MSMLFAYTDDDRRRLAPEPVKASTSRRTVFQRDRARILHSSGLRRLAGKTQVFTVGKDDFPRTRLTHTLEVAQIGREIAVAFGCDPDIVDAAGLAHDLGHPPFGHAGEAVLDRLCQDCGGFEGNAQTLRILTRLEPKIVVDNVSAGLNLTRAVLDASTKYPWTKKPGQSKYSVYEEDKEVFVWIRQGTPFEQPCFEATIMDWADDVAYSVHDLEDGIHSGRIRLETLTDSQQQQQFCQAVADKNGTETAADLLELFREILADPVVRAVFHYDASFPAQVALKALTSYITGLFVSAAIKATRDHYGNEPLGRYQAQLVVPRIERARWSLLKGLADYYVISPAQADRHHLTTIIERAMTVITDQAPGSLDPQYRSAWEQSDTDQQRQRAIVDQIASLTDTSIQARFGTDSSSSFRL